MLISLAHPLASPLRSAGAKSQGGFLLLYFSYSTLLLIPYLYLTSSYLTALSLPNVDYNNSKSSIGSRAHLCVVIAAKHTPLYVDLDVDSQSCPAK